LDPDTNWLCRLVSGGAGGVFRICVDDGDVGSGVLPAASLSNTDSRSDSWLALVGAAGKGLFRSVGDRTDCADSGLVEDCCGPFRPGRSEVSIRGVFSSLSSTFMSLPCLELGGGGFRLSDDARPSVANLRRSSSGSEISWDVRGDSECISCIGSNIDCLDADEDASVLLPPSFNASCPIFIGGAKLEAGAVASALPVMSNRLNASTSREALPTPVPPGVLAWTGVLDKSPLSVRSKVANVFWNGFGGTEVLWTVSVSSPESSELSVVAFSKGSLSVLKSPGRGIGVGRL
jgi:hypothetical protein